MNAAAVRAESALRLVAGLVAMIASAWLLAVGRGWLSWSLGAISLTFAALWASRFTRTRGAATVPEHNYLELGPEGLIQAKGTRICTVPWHDVGQISIDEDSLVVCVGRTNLPELRIEPHYGSLGLRELAEIVYKYSQLVKARPNADGACPGTCTDAEDD